MAKHQCYVCEKFTKNNEDWEAYEMDNSLTFYKKDIPNFDSTKQFQVYVLFCETCSKQYTRIRKKLNICNMFAQIEGLRLFRLKKIKENT